MFNARFTIFYLYLFSHIFNWNSPGLQSQQISEKCFNVFSDCEMRVADYGCAGEESMPWICSTFIVSLVTSFMQIVQNYLRNWTYLVEWRIQWKLSMVKGERCVEAIIFLLASVPICSLEHGFNSFYRRRKILRS